MILHTEKRKNPYKRYIRVFLNVDDFTHQTTNVDDSTADKQLMLMILQQTNS